VEKNFSQSELEAIAAALGDTSEGLTGPEIGHILASLKMSDPTPAMTKWKRLHNAFVERQSYTCARAQSPLASDHKAAKAIVSLTGCSVR
jgi:hypothetical protein